MSTLPEERLGQLRVAKLRALLGDRLAGEPRDAGPFGTGAALVTPDGTGAVLVESAGPRALGGALVWALRKGATALVLIVDADPSVAGRLAREATWFDLPVTVERIEGTTSVPVAPAPFDPPAPDPEVPTDIAALIASVTAPDTELRTVVEHGVARVELRGLEVARVVVPDGGGAPALEVGVGRFDREISSMMFANAPTADALAKAVELVARHRAPGATVHPLRDLVPERWLRELVVGEPALVGAAQLTPVASALAVESLREPQPAAAVGTTVDGRPLVVVCTAGVDLDVVPVAADTRALVAPEAELVICAPQRNLLAPLRAVGERLIHPARYVAVELPV